MKALKLIKYVAAIIQAVSAALAVLIDRWPDYTEYENGQK